MSVHRSRALVAAALLCAASALAAEQTGAAEAPPALRGFDLDLTLTESSGLYFAPEGYLNVLSVSLDSSFALGQVLFPAGWAEPLKLSASLSLDGELSGNDPSYRGASFASPALFRDSPEAALLVPPAGDAVDGTQRQAVVSDLRLGISHDRLFTLPTVAIDAGAGLRLVLPLSAASRNAGLWGAPTLSLSLHRSLGPLTLRWEGRGTAYFFSSTTSRIQGPTGTVQVGGLEVEPYRPSTTGVPNLSHALVNSLSASMDLPRRFTLGAEYSLIHAFAHRLEGCAVENLPTADLCRDGPALGFVQGAGQRDSQSFWLEVGFKPAEWGQLGLGLSTARPVRAPDGAIANPFLQLNRDNYSTLYLSLYVNAEALASTLHPAPVSPK